MLKHNTSCTELLTILQEECAEVIQIISKIKRFGMEEDTMERFSKEMGDLQCMMELAQEWDLVSYTDLDKFADLKREKLKKWSNLFE
jgi:hypothetical protein